MLAHIVTPTSITVVIEGIPQVIDTSHPNFFAISESIRDQQWDRVPGLIDVASSVASFSKGKLEIQANQVLYQGEPLNNSAAYRLLQLMRDGFNIDPLIAFLENVCENPDSRAVEGLYDWLERGNLPLTEDGCIVAYKIVTSDFKDVYTQKMDNSIGAVVEMPRFRVDNDPDRTCSAGLHFCSAEYLPHFGVYGASRKVVLVKVNPRDVVAFPHDYNISKGRCCRYEVMEEIPAYKAEKYFENSPSIYSFGDFEDEDQDPYAENAYDGDWDPYA